MSIIKLITTVILAVALITMITSIQSSIYAATEDDGWVEGDYEGSLEEQEEQAQEDWEDAGRPGDTDNDDNDDNDDNEDNEEQMFTCSDGSTVTENEECPSTEPNPYCDTGRGKAAPVCHDRLDYDQNSGLYPCNDGTSKVDWRDCKDATEDDNDNDNNTDSNDNNGKGCYDIGLNDGQNGGYNQNIYNENADCYGGYYKGFMKGCQDEGNRLGVCQNAADIGKEPNPTDVMTQSCYDLGYNDGHDNMQFSKQTYSHCSRITSYDEYYVGFRIGCTSAGDTIDVCENATDE
jgi:hypothetical protein